MENKYYNMPLNVQARGIFRAREILDGLQKNLSSEGWPLVDLTTPGVIAIGNSAVVFRLGDCGIEEYYPLLMKVNYTKFEDFNSGKTRKALLGNPVVMNFEHDVLKESIGLFRKLGYSVVDHKQKLYSVIKDGKLPAFYQICPDVSEEGKYKIVDLEETLKIRNLEELMKQRDEMVEEILRNVCYDEVNDPMDNNDCETYNQNKEKKLVIEGHSTQDGVRPPLKKIFLVKIHPNEYGELFIGDLDHAGIIPNQNIRSLEKRLVFV